MSKDKGAIFSPCRKFRYVLWRTWPKEYSLLTNNHTYGHACFIGLSPSTATETEDDPTVRRCIGFAKTFGCEGLYMLNIFAFRATDPEIMKAEFDPVGPENDRYLL